MLRLAALAGALAALLLLPADAASETPGVPLDGEPLDRVLDWLRARTRHDGCVAPEPAAICGHASTRDAVLAISSAGIDPENWSSDGASSLTYLLVHRSELDSESGACAACPWAKTIVVLAASGLNPRHADGYDYVERLDEHYRGGQVGDPSQVNDDAWALFAYAGVDSPDPAKIEAIRLHLLSRQNPADGGWSWNLASESEAWGTATVALALLATGSQEEDSSIQKAVAFLRTQQGDSGLVLQDGYDSAESTALTLQVAKSLGQDPSGPSWTRNGHGLVDALRALQQPDGSFAHNAQGGSKFLATTQVVPALRGLPYPFRPPVIVASASTTQAAVGRTIEFRCEARDPDGTIVRVAWDWGDGTAQEAAQATHAYATPGRFEATCRAIDDDGVERMRALRLQIVEAPPPGGPTAPEGSGGIDSTAMASGSALAAPPEAPGIPGRATPAPGAWLALISALLVFAGERRKRGPES